jgi:hypothetical protein
MSRSPVYDPEDPEDVALVLAADNPLGLHRDGLVRIAGALDDGLASLVAVAHVDRVSPQIVPVAGRYFDTAFVDHDALGRLELRVPRLDDRAPVGADDSSSGEGKVLGSVTAAVRVNSTKTSRSSTLRLRM